MIPMTSPTVAAVLDSLSRRIRFDKAASWDPSGLQIGDPEAPVRRMGVCHEVTEQVVEAVLAEPVDLLVTYHPLLFRPTTALVAGSGAPGRALTLAREGVAVAVAHTAFDVTPGGTGDALAEAIGLDDVGGFGPEAGTGQVKVVTFVPDEAVEVVAAAMARAGAGVIGNYSACSFRSQGVGAFLPGEGADPTVGEVGRPNREPEVRIEMVAPATRWQQVVAAMVSAHPYEEPAYDVYEVKSNLGFVGRIGMLGEGTRLGEVVERVGSVCGRRTLRMAGDPEREVRRVAVVPGSGSSFLDRAAAAGAEVVVTGDLSHHRVREMLDRGIAVVDPGHTGSERPGVGRLLEWVAGMVDAEVVDFTGIDPSPWR